MELKEEDVVMCTVKGIEGTTIFLHIEGDGEGSMVMSEVAAGRIRNLREYVAPNKKIVCKVLKIIPGNIQLSLRRVTSKEKEEVMERFKKEKTFSSILKSITPNFEKVIEEIKTKYDILNFVEEAKKNPKLISPFLNKEESEKLTKILEERNESEKEARKIIIIKTSAPSGINDIKDALKSKEDIRYLGSSRFMISSKGKDFKEANIKLNTIIASIEKKAKEKKMEFSIEDK